MMGALKGMFSFFTMIRLDITQEDMDAMDRRFWLVPIVGALYGLIAAVMMTVLTQFDFVNPLVAAAITFFVIFAFNRFLHIDGTIDIGDGLVVSGTREDHLRALKDSRIGAGGMAFALMIILMNILMVAAVPILLMALVLFSAEVLAKIGMVSAAAFGEPGNGMAGNSVRNTKASSLLFAIILGVIMIVSFGLLIHGLQEYTEIPVALVDNYIILLIAALIVSIFTGLIMSAVAKKNFGMVNGDVLGATNEITRVTVLLTFLMIISVI
jgi:adenosylcobinamide-GDP ribazoletransferase